MPPKGKSDAAADEHKKQLRKNAEYKEHQMSPQDVAQEYKTSLTEGLKKGAAENLLAQHGENRLTAKNQRPKWLKFIDEMTGKFNLLLWVGGGLCFLGYGLKNEIDNLYLGIVLCVVVFLTGCFSFYQNSKSDDLMNSFKNMLPPEIDCVRDGNRNPLEASKLVIGDIVELKGGDLVPADIVIFKCSDNMCVNNSSITGEAEPLKRKPECTDADPLETANLAFFGTQVPEGTCSGIVIRTGDDTFMGRVASLAMDADEEQTPINREIHLFIDLISGIALVLGVSFCIINMLMGTDHITNLVFVIGIIVANVPEGLLATVTVCLTLTANRMHKKKVMVKNLEGVETLGSTSCICSDKTGTLTQNVMTVAQVVYGDEDGFKIQDCASSFTRGNKTFDENSPAFKKLQRCATLNNTSYFDDKSKFMIDETGSQVKRPFMEDVVQGDGSILEQVAWKAVGNASECAMIKLCQPFGDIEEMRKNNSEVFAIPFNSRNKFQVHVNCQEQFNGEGSTDAKRNRGARVVLMKGAPERILPRCTSAWMGSREVQMDQELTNRINALNVKLAENGLRCLAFAERELSDTSVFTPEYAFSDGSDSNYGSVNFPVGDTRTEGDAGKQIYPAAKEGLCYLGIMALVDPPRPAVPGAVAKCKSAGIKVVMVTGDHPVTAEAIAYKVGILWSRTEKQINIENANNGVTKDMPGWIDPQSAEAIVVAGSDLDDKNQEWWDLILDHPQIVFARTSPQQKLVIVENTMRLGHIVAVTGDGVNDSPALKKAHIGVAMGIMGSDVSKQAADMILLDDNFASIVAGVEEGRLIFDNLKKSICYTLTSNIPEISPFLCFVIIQTPLPLSTVLILAIDLGTDMVPAISMAYEKAEADIMMRPPRDATVDRLVTKKLICLAYLQIGIMQASAGFYSWMVVLNDYGYPPHILTGLGKGDYWNKIPLFCKFDGGQWVDVDGYVLEGADPSEDAPTRRYSLWDRGDGGRVKECVFPLRNLAGGEGTPSNWDYTEGSTFQAGKTNGYLQVTIEAMVALEINDYFEYIPFRGRTSPFWQNSWMWYHIDQSSDTAEFAGGPLRTNVKAETFFQYAPTGLWTICGADNTFANDGSGSLSQVTAGQAWIDAFGGKVTQTQWDDTVLDGVCAGAMGDGSYDDAEFCDGKTDTAACRKVDNSTHQMIYCDDCNKDCYNNYDENAPNYASRANKKQCLNIASRMVQYEALKHAQGAYFVCIVVVQWADLLICKTRWLSIRHQGMGNSQLNFGLFFETLLAACLCYFPFIHDGLGTRDIRLTHWFPGIPFSILIFAYDETRKYLMRQTSPEIVDPATGQVKRKAGWIERNTYY